MGAPFKLSLFLMLVISMISAKVFAGHHWRDDGDDDDDDDWDDDESDYKVSPGAGDSGMHPPNGAGAQPMPAPYPYPYPYTPPLPGQQQPPITVTVTYTEVVTETAAATETADPMNDESDPDTGSSASSLVAGSMVMLAIAALVSAQLA